MPFTVSPGISVSEIDLTAIVPTTSTITGGFAGPFQWGPIEKATLIGDENTLKSLFYAPDDLTYLSYYSVINYLGYGAQSYVVRAANSSATNATTANTTYGASVAGTTYLLKNSDTYASLDPDQGGTGLPTGVGPVIAKYAGERGNSLKISYCTADKAGDDLTGTVTIASTTMTGVNTLFLSELEVGDVIANSTGGRAVVSSITNATSAVVVSEGDMVAGTSVERLTRSAFEETSDNMLGTITVGAGSKDVVGSGTAFSSQFNLGDKITFSDGVTRKVTAINSDTSMSIDTAVTTAKSGSYGREWEYRDRVTLSAPTTTATIDSKVGSQASDEVHIVIVDRDGGWVFPGQTGSRDQVLLNLQGSSVAYDSPDYYKTKINNSAYAWFIDHPSGTDAGEYADLDWGSSSVDAQTFGGRAKVFTYNFLGGVDGTVVTDAELLTAWQKYESSDTDISLIYTGAVSKTIAASVISIADARKDCVVFVSPEISDIRGVDEVTAIDNIKDFRNALGSSSYAVMDSGWKYQVDTVNGPIRTIPLNPDIAGICARTENDRGSFFSPAGFTRGQVRNVGSGLVFNPTQTARDELYRNGVNSVVTFGVDGTVLFGDKTLQAKPTAFDRINVRRLFITLERSISRAARGALFEFNDAFTRAQFVSIVDPFLRGIQSRGGIFDYAVICDGTNNPPAVVDANQFVGSIFVKPARSINFIELNFVAVRSGVEFSEVVQRA